MLAVGEEPQEGPSFPEWPGTWTVHQDFREYGGGLRRWVVTWTFRPTPPELELGPEPELDFSL
jgi:hypothetical protein